MDERPWQLRALRKSIKKKDKLRILDRLIAADPDRAALDIGCAQGTLSWFLRRKGGRWVHTDLDAANLAAARELLGGPLVRTGAAAFPFRTAAFDLATCLDYLEHIDEDRACLAEIARLLKPGGELIVVTPRTGRFHLLHRARAALGLGLEIYGHKREGYTLRELREMVREAGLEPGRHVRYARFFSESAELVLNFLYAKVFARRDGPSALRDGRIKPSSAADYAAQEKTLRMYGFVYPFVWLASRLDKVLVLSKGYTLVLQARKPRHP